ncbi:protoporphyrinogen oxidase [Daktulosphaira vitifoliae]|uniref:protoporphyrinogen oxidase n=1 Tax=Daktulosphaira vitifoliae TaxID=58002 RepID=UPI0021A9E1B8|nr:protoporphyrinogen oxidase [Daktulosphaira vitifoliae]XP_050526586.1 protoporphyrinogen oxidase [Daktulosphaira vitifoliae]XP_050526587.1 protoporphyrinogen oxidase [Daktulosphaira vitifoliae]XP_050526589.1 protoporphyrinogen oxidase [Daktulosphaira vitifoliae]XP_050526590.1 protoporphyrinogen oxidase [Daktulosphaira vitifoliae]
MTIGILGGGIAGLSIAYYLKKSGINDPISIIELNDYSGGWVHSYVDKKTNVITELGPRTIRGSGDAAYNTISLIKELGIYNLVKPISTDAGSRYIYVNGRVHKLPNGFFQALFTVNPPFTHSWSYYILREIFLAKNSTSNDFDGDESSYSFFCRRFGKEFADYLISSLLCGICGGDAKSITIKLMFGKLYEAERKHGKVILGLLKESWSNHLKGANVPSPIEKSPAIYYLEGGLQQLARALHLRNENFGTNIQLKTKCTELHFHDKGATVLLSNGQLLECSHVISALPSHTLASILKEKNDYSSLISLLKSIPTVSIVTANLSYKNPDVLQKYKGFGVLTPPQENISLLGITFDSCLYGLQDQVDLTVMMGGHSYQKYFGSDTTLVTEDNLTKTAIEHVQRVLDIQEMPYKYSARVLKNCIPQYTLGHYDRIAKIQNYISNKQLPLTLVGSSYHGISINDVIFASLKASKTFLKR